MFIVLCLSAVFLFATGTTLRNKKLQNNAVADCNSKEVLMTNPYCVAVSNKQEFCCLYNTKIKIHLINKLKRCA